ncbi:hypothetical protein DIPPA_52099 [Diplonema papillatum]|nr:hypothetical protein DIPPA_52099 [Diplonema papillatum]
MSTIACVVLLLEVCSAVGTVRPFLERARNLLPPKVAAIKDGEAEGREFWDMHAGLLQKAVSEWGQYHKSLYTAEGIETYVSPGVKAAVSSGDETAILSHVSHTAASEVYAIELFTPDFRRDFLEELTHWNNSGIPIRRPNGMNRYGMILGDFGFDDALNRVARKYVGPIAQALYPAFVGATDIVEQYTFTIRYSEGGDLSLSPHTDASAVTLNLCLGTEFSGGAISFYGEPGMSATDKSTNLPNPSIIESKLGVALIHRGLHKHSASPLVHGERYNMVMWLTAKDGYVRVAPYEASEQTTQEDRWSKWTNEEL